MQSEKLEWWRDSCSCSVMYCDLFAARLLQWVRDADGEPSETQIPARCPDQEWNHCQVGQNILILCANVHNIFFWRLKLVPDERRSQQSSTLYGSGTILVDQEFLFHVNMYRISILHLKLQFPGSFNWARESRSEWRRPNLQGRPEKKCLLVQQKYHHGGRGLWDCGNAVYSAILIEV